MPAELSLSLNHWSSDVEGLDVLEHVRLHIHHVHVVANQALQHSRHSRPLQASFRIWKRPTDKTNSSYRTPTRPNNTFHPSEMNSCSSSAVNIASVLVHGSAV
jgi:hypothetical protein